MVLQTERDELLAAWSALSGDAGSNGWRTIRVACGAPCPLFAGRRFPGNEEALLVGFESARVPRSEELPQGKGFLVTRTDFGGCIPGLTWIALIRQSQGRLDFFASMAVDVVAILAAMKDQNRETVVDAFVARIRAWQEFMLRGDDGLLRAEAELGLFGEIEMLLAISSAGLWPSSAVDAWQGPLGGIRDFSLGAGAIEVKSTLSHAGFPAKVGSLDQLDDSVVQPIFLAGVRLTLSSAGRTLPELVMRLRATLGADGAVLAAIDSRLIHAGFVHQVASSYTRRFSVVGIKLLLVAGSFPRLTQGNVPPEIRAARYDLDLDLVHGWDTTIEGALERLGVI
ncbi:PD-(D/E)XK motif protein [Candidatus Accumulibacter sp. ACC003]|uniref:PD-(D/E)XK motif protein n=1 Tax=Candidatus Accumulibacter sp. ACC003 TaxID=2823334 RepID=UPI0025BCFEFD|nr:PD-(D/E)XK motif protein [Candidatus Accumulibacter sp. ACC003]